VVDLCPVGALTDDDFRFRCRVWYLEEEKSICPHCASGCNIWIHYNVRFPWKAGGDRIMRLKPRENLEVNAYWMCDVGRYGYRFVDAKDRILSPNIRAGDGWMETGWEEALGSLARSSGMEGSRFDPERVVVVPSPWMSNEAIYLLQKLLREAAGIRRIGIRKGDGSGGEDGFLLRNDRSPNRRGLEMIGLEPDENSETPVSFLEGMGREGCDLLVLFLGGPEAPADSIRIALERAAYSIVLTSNYKEGLDAATVLLPVATFAESTGSFTNFEGRIQRFQKAFDPAGDSLPDWRAICELANQLFGIPAEYASAPSVFEDLCRAVPLFEGLTWSGLGDGGYLPHDAAKLEGPADGV
jgi:NADH-quinone oxidoreductase subunit G